ncbi:hypothetical protein ACLKA7_005556, partial [Drosophila subpalustris]
MQTSSWLSSRPNNGEGLSAYASRIVTTLCTKMRNMDHEKIAVAYMRTAFTSNIKNRRDLQSQSITPNWEPETKRAKAMEVQCYLCGKLSPKKVDCRAGTGSRSEKRVELCVVDEPKSFMMIQ